MKYRKIIAFGNSSYVVSLPKNWIKKHNLTKGMLIGLDEREDTIIIQPQSLENKSITNPQLIIEIDGKPLQSLEREIKSAYINNFKEIKLTGKTIRDRNIDIQKILHDLMALEVIEQDTTQIIAKDFLNMKEISLNDIIKKMDSITRSMLLDTQQTFYDDVYENINERDKDVNRLFYLACRGIKHGLRHPSIAKAIYDVENNEELLNMWLLVENIEHVADASKRVSRYMKRINIDKGQQQKAVQIFEKVTKAYTGMMEAFYKKDANKAHQLSELKDTYLDECDTFFKENKDAKNVPFLIDRLKHMITHVHDMGKAIYQ